MTTTQPPLKPGQHVYIEFVVDGDNVLWPVLATGEVSDAEFDYLDPPSDFRWHPMPAEDSPDAAHVTADTIKAALAAIPADYERERRELPQRILAERNAYAADVVRLTNHIAGLEADREKFRDELASRGFPRLWTAETDALAAIDTLRQGRDEARAEVDRMRPVVDTAEAWRDILSANAADLLVNPIRRAVVLAVDAYRAGEKAPADAPAPRQDDEPVADDHGQTTEAQGGAEAVPVLAVDTPVLLADGPMQWRVATWDVVEDESGRSAIVGLRPMLARPAAAQPQPTDAPGRRDWAGEIAVAYAEAKRALPTDAHEDDFGREIAAALGLHALEDERDDLRERVAATEDLNDSILAVGRKYRAERDEAAGKLDALRGGVEALAGQCRERALKRPGEPIPGDLWWIGSPVGVERELRALLDAPPTTTPDGTGTAKASHQAGCICVECEDASDNGE